MISSKISSKLKNYNRRLISPSLHSYVGLPLLLKKNAIGYQTSLNDNIRQLQNLLPGSG